MADPRSAALTVLEKCRRSGAWSDAVLGSVMDAEGLKGPDRGLCTALCYGVIQQRSWLDYALSSASNLPLHKVEPKVLDILRISLYQLMFLRRVPAYAAVSEGVGLCRSLGYGPERPAMSTPCSVRCPGWSKCRSPAGAERNG